MGDIVKRRIYGYILAVMGLFALLTAFLCFFGIKREREKVDISGLRVLSSEVAAEVESEMGDFQGSFENLSFAVLDNDGNVLYQQGLSLSAKVNLHSLSLSDYEAKYYTVPLLHNGVQEGTLYLEIPKEYFGGKKGNYLLIFGGGFLALSVAGILGLLLLKVLKKDVFQPIGLLHESTKEILNGRLDTPVRYDYDGEVGQLCHDFELMRTELLDSFHREQKLKEDEKLLMASISHDLKTPLATVQGYLESICLEVVTEPAEVRQYAKSAYDKTVLLGSLTNDILELSKAEMHELSIRKEEVYSGTFFEELSEALQSDAKSRGFTLTFSEIPNVLLSIDKTRISQVMENLVGNSFKYGKKNGQIEILFQEKGKDFFVTVKDDGQGIAAEDLPFVFQRFFRGDKARTQGVPGSGLGLSIAKYIVEQHDGRIECDSVRNQGTTVTFSIAEP